ncbi:hypothetical protein SKAU_G00274310 [Synaphobranchus kaupii]|uniref:Fork-head domain-containing protein n=1 Tax=Synaphobranchus kaupii TaxID=118154 RepID=A0A9Q1IQP5_SYNKA|nr:hypothetical protein SKAU_G00274310 [Synaphobranchus kaupii]
MVDHEGSDGEKSTARSPPVEDKQELSQLEPEKAHTSWGATQRKGISRRNAWGNQSYADLISQAIESSPEKRLTLAQIYDWMVSTVPYFKDKGDSNSSAGWKNSIRHNLSLHNKFLRVNNESTCKSSWWMLNSEGSKGTKAPRQRAASMDSSSSKLLKSRMRAKQTKKQAGTAGPGEAGGSTPAEGAVDGPGPSQLFPNWGVKSSSILSHSSLDDLDAWTSFRPRPRTSPNASTLSGRLSPITPGQGDKEHLPEDVLLDVPSTLTEALMEELDLIDGLTLMAGHSIGVNPKPLLSFAATLPPQVTSFTSFTSLQTPMVTEPPYSQTHMQFSVSPHAGSNFGFGSAVDSPKTGSISQEAQFRAHVPSALEVLLTSDSPPPCDMKMTQTDRLMPNHDWAGLLGLGVPMTGEQSNASQPMLGKNIKPNLVPTTTMQPQQPSQSQLGTSLPGLYQDATQLTTVKDPVYSGPQQSRLGATFLETRYLQRVGSTGSHGMGSFVGPSCFTSSQDKLPVDLDLDMFIENLDWDVDCSMNSNFMDGDGFDLNFDPIVPTS